MSEQNVPETSDPVPAEPNVERAAFIAEGKQRVTTALRGYESPEPLDGKHPHHPILAAAHALLEHIWDAGHEPERSPAETEYVAQAQSPLTADQA